MATKRYDNKFFFHPSLLLLFLDPGSGMGKIQDIRDKHPGSATLAGTIQTTTVYALTECEPELYIFINIFTERMITGMNKLLRIPGTGARGI